MNKYKLTDDTTYQGYVETEQGLEPAVVEILPWYKNPRQNQLGTTGVLVIEVNGQLIYICGIVEDEEPEAEENTDGQVDQ